MTSERASAGPPAHMMSVGLLAFAGSALADSFVAPLLQMTAPGDRESAISWVAQSTAVGLAISFLVVASSQRRLLAGAGWSPMAAPPPRGAVWAFAVSVVFGGWDWLLYLTSAAWSETAIAAVMFAQWATLIVAFFAVCDRWFPTPGRAPRRFHARAGAAMGIAPLGVALVTLSQIPRGEPMLPGSLGGEEALGVLLGLASAAMAAVTVGSTVIYGEKTAAHYGLGHQGALCHTLIGMLARDSIRLLVLAGAAYLAGGSTPSWTGPALIAAASSVSGLLLRAGNSLPFVPATANMIALTAPALSVLWLAIDGISIPRLSTYLGGAAVILLSLSVGQWPQRSAEGKGGPGR